MRARLSGRHASQPVTVWLAGPPGLPPTRWNAWARTLEQTLEAMRNDHPALGLPPVRVARLTDVSHLVPGIGRYAVLVASEPHDAAAATEEARWRERLSAAGVPYAVVPPLPQGMEAALSAVRAGLRQPPAGPRWRWICPDCDDGDCESGSAHRTGQTGPHGDAPFPVLHRAADWLAIHKPAGWLVHRTGLDAHEPRVVLQALREQLGRPVYPVHRLDKGTSGVLVMALSREAAGDWAPRFAGRSLDKRYIALVRGWPPASFTVDHPLRPDDAPPDAPAQDAVTRFTRLATLQIDAPLAGWPTVRAALVEARPLTGRRHQIRRHLKHASHPVIGDATHGKGQHNRWWAQHLGIGRLWLHARSLREEAGWLLPVLDSPLDAPFNADWARLLRLPQWRWDEAGAGLAGLPR